MYRKGHAAVHIHGNGDIDATIAYYRRRIDEIDTKEAAPKPDEKNPGSYSKWMQSRGHNMDKLQHFQKMIDVLEKRKQEKESKDRVHKPSSMNPPWRDPNSKKYGRFWRFYDHGVVFTQRPRGARGPSHVGQLCTLGVAYDPNTEEDQKDRTTRLTELEELSSAAFSEFRIAVRDRKATYDGHPARIFILAGRDVDVEFVKSDLPALIRMYNKQRSAAKLQLV